MLNDGVSAMFAELEANQAAAILADGIVNTMPRALVARQPDRADIAPALGQADPRLDQAARVGADRDAGALRTAERVQATWRRLLSTYQA